MLSSAPAVNEPAWPHRRWPCEGSLLSPFGSSLPLLFHTSALSHLLAFHSLALCHVLVPLFIPLLHQPSSRGKKCLQKQGVCGTLHLWVPLEPGWLFVLAPVKPAVFASWVCSCTHPPLFVSCSDGWICPDGDFSNSRGKKVMNSQCLGQRLVIVWCRQSCQLPGSPLENRKQKGEERPGSTWQDWERPSRTVESPL